MNYISYFGLLYLAYHSLMNIIKVNICQKKKNCTVTLII